MLMAMLQAKLMVATAGERVARRLRDESGQVATEYLGVLVVIAAIIGVLVTSGIGEQLAGLIGEAIQSVFDAGG